MISKDLDLPYSFLIKHRRMRENLVQTITKTITI